MLVKQVINQHISGKPVTSNDEKSLAKFKTNQRSNLSALDTVR